MKYIKHNLLIIFSLIALSPVWIQCDDDSSIDDTPDRLFRPINFTSSIDGTDVEFSWTLIANADYLLGIVREGYLDTLFFSVTGGVSSLTVTDLWSNTTYMANIKAVSQIEGIEDSYYQTRTFTTGTENIFYTVSDSDIGPNFVSLKWITGKNVSRIIISKPDSSTEEITLSESDISAGEKLIENLDPETLYKFEIYLGEMLRGTISITSKSL